MPRLVEMPANVKRPLEVRKGESSVGLLCSLGLHAWDGCVCRRCRATRPEGHAWEGCTCRTCRGTREEGHDWTAWGLDVAPGSLEAGVLLGDETWTRRCRRCRGVERRQPTCSSTRQDDHVWGTWDYVSAHSSRDELVGPEVWVRQCLRCGQFDRTYTPPPD